MTVIEKLPTRQSAALLALKASLERAAFNRQLEQDRLRILANPATPEAVRIATRLRLRGYNVTVGGPN